MKKYIKTIILIGIILALGIYGVFVEPNKLEITNYTIQDKSLQGIKIVFASDFHIKPHQQKRLEEIVELINLQEPDLVLSAGDFVSGHLKHTTMPPEDIAKGLGKIKSKYGLYTTLGNHDGWYDANIIANKLETNGIKVLSNSNAKLDINGKTVYIAGVEDLTTGKPNIYQALDETKSPVILLTHNPDVFVKVPSDINLTLAGHTHGGQIRLPFLGAPVTASAYKNKYAKGFIEEKGKKLITTTGIGVSILPIRFNCPPEIVVIEFE